MLNTTAKVYSFCILALKKSSWCEWFCYSCRTMLRSLARNKDKR